MHEELHDAVFKDKLKIPIAFCSMPISNRLLNNPKQFKLDFCPYQILLKRGTYCPLYQVTKVNPNNIPRND